MKSSVVDVIGPVGDAAAVSGADMYSNRTHANHSVAKGLRYRRIEAERGSLSGDLFWNLKKNHGRKENGRL